MAAGKRVGARRAARPRPTLNPAALGIGAGITLCVIAWGYLVYAAIDFGTAARAGEGAASWSLMLLAALGAIACLFAGLMMVNWLLRVLGIITPDEPSGDSGLAAPPRVPGGKRAIR